MNPEDTYPLVDKLRLNANFARLKQGRLILRDGSIYNGMWRYGKRSGLGTYYFSNGDVFQGSWRDDVMHGKVGHFHCDVYKSY